MNNFETESKKIQLEIDIQQLKTSKLQQKK